jgi:cell division protein FtsL
MSPRTAAAAAVARTAGTIHAPGRPHTRPRPAPARRRSGAAAKPRTAARPASRKAPQGDFVAVLDRVLRGPLYIATVGILLVGIVFFNVDVLELNRGVARTDAQAAHLKRENAALTLELAKLGSSERIQQVALERGLVLPQPGDVRYLRAHRLDAGRALRVMTAPDPSGAAAGVPTSVSQVSQPDGSAPPVVAQTAPAQTAPAQTTPAETAPAQTAPAEGQTPAAATPQSTAGQTPAQTQTQSPPPTQQAATQAGAVAADG